MKRGINRWLQVALAGVVVTAGAGVAGADQGMPGGMGEHRGPMMMAQSGGPGGHPGHGPGARAMNPEQAKARMNERIRRMLAGVGASEQQITQVQGIWASAMTDLAAIRRAAGLLVRGAPILAAHHHEHHQPHADRAGQHRQCVQR